MKLIRIIAVLLTLSACTEKQNNRVSAPAYDDSWYVSPGWPGEYPNGFTILQEGVVLAGRAEMNKSAPKTLQCPVPKLANFNPWNHQRVAADQLTFMSAAKKFMVIMTEDADVPVFDDATDEILSLKKGDTLTYLTYIAEGFALLEYQDTEYQVDLAELENTAAFSQPDIADDLWANIPCADGQRGWILHAELQGVDGVGETEHTAYGESPDIKP